MIDSLLHGRMKVLAFAIAAGILAKPQARYMMQESPKRGLGDLCPGTAGLITIVCDSPRDGVQTINFSDAGSVELDNLVAELQHSATEQDGFLGRGIDSRKLYVGDRSTSADLGRESGGAASTLKLE